MTRRKGDAGVDGLLVVDKPAGMTSHDVVSQMRRRLGTRRVGHAGTLDPDATGVLLVLAGRMTRLARFYQDLRKAYTGEVVLGATTSTLDAAGDVTGTFDMSTVGLADLRTAAVGLTGDILQVPPMVSALKVDGRRLHELAREGIEVERQARPVSVYRYDVGDQVEPGVFPIEVECSSGTYVRTLAADLGAAAGGGAHLRNLRRTAIGAFTVTEARPIDTAPLIEPMAAVTPFSPLTVSDALAARIGQGAVLDAGDLPVVGDGPWAVVHDGAVLALYERHRGDRVKPAVVLA